LIERKLGPRSRGPKLVSRGAAVISLAAMSARILGIPSGCVAQDVLRSCVAKKNLARAKGAELRPAPAEQILRKLACVLEKAQFQRVL
jgi:hypothetical protein